MATSHWQRSTSLLVLGLSLDRMLRTNSGDEKPKGNQSSHQGHALDRRLSSGGLNGRSASTESPRIPRETFSAS